MNIYFLHIFVCGSLILANGTAAQDEHDQLIQTRHIACETGEVYHLQDQPPKIVRALKDGPVVYAEDVNHQLYSFSIDDNNTLERTKIFRLPILGSLYNAFKPNYLTLSRGSNDYASWAISHVTYEDPNCVTISLFEMVQTNPIMIRNRDPWLHPFWSYMHTGPLNMVGIHITALGEWVAISGYQKDSGEKIFAYRKLNYDLAGHNFLMSYQLQGQETVTWQPPSFMKRLAKRIGVSQNVIHLPLPDWQVLEMNELAQPNILLKRHTLRDGSIKILLNIHLNNSGCLFFDPEDARYTDLSGEDQQPGIIDTVKSPCPWPALAESRSLHLTEEQSPHPATRPATLNGMDGKITLLSQEPLYGRFQAAHDGTITNIYAVLRGPLDFLFNHICYFDDAGKSVKFKMK